MTRGDLEWMLTIAENGTLMEDGLLPSFIQMARWPQSSKQIARKQHPATKLILQHPQPYAIEQIIDQLSIDGPIEVRPGTTNLIFEMQTKAGELVSLSSASV